MQGKHPTATVRGEAHSPGKKAVREEKVQNVS